MRLFLLFTAVLFVSFVNPGDVASQPKQGDKSIGLSFNRITFGHETAEMCDSTGNQCNEENETTNWSIGIGLWAGYLLTDLIEVGGGIGFSKHQSRTEYTDSENWSENPYSSINVSGYSKLHFSFGSKVVPFVRAGGGWSKSTAEYKSNDNYNCS